MFTDKNVVITGASSGLGRALAVALSHKGANILLAGRDEHALAQTKALCVGDGDISIFVGDITAPEDTQRLLTAATASKNLDMLFLNAGMSMWSEFKDLPDIDVFRQMMEVNFFANVDLLHKALPFLLQSRGHVVAISSFQGKMGVPYHTAYAASKHALVGWIDSLRLEVEPQVQFLSVFPSWLKGTNLRSNSFVELGNKKVQHQSDKGTDVYKCSQEILRALEKGKKQLFIPKWYKWLPVVRFLIPDMLDRIIVQKTQKNIC